MGFTERVQAYIAAKYYVYLTERFQDRGKKAFLHSVQYYASQRGRRMAQRAIRDGRDLTQETYNYYGEWVNTEEIRSEGTANVMAAQPDGSLHITVCPWYEQFRSMGLLEAGKLYCSDLDASISRGFNPLLGYKVTQTMYEGSCCIHRLAAGDVAAGAQKGKNPEGLRSFSYHCAHTYWTFYEVSCAIFRAEGQQAAEDVLRDLAADYGQEMADELWTYRNTNFNVCD